jgi:uncharacterized membrane protein YkoI
MWHRVIQSVVVVLLVVGLCGCCKCLRKQGEKKEAPAQVVTLTDVPAPARAAIEKLTAGGQIRKIEKAEEAGKTVYDVEATVQGKDVEYDIAADGKILTSEESVPYASLPATVRAAAQKYFGSAEGLKASKEIENGKTFYEVEGKKGKTTAALKLSDTGQILEEEKE